MTGAKQIAEGRPRWEIDDLFDATTDELMDVWSGKPFERFDELEWYEVLLGFWATDDPKTFNALPERITIYRGSPLEHTARNGHSWSTSKEIGLKFAGYFNPIGAGGSFMAPIPGGGFLATAEIDKADVAMFINDRKEFECILHPDNWPEDAEVIKIIGEKVDIE